MLGKTPGKSGVSIPGPGVGYMPQEITLYPELTIEESMYFFGLLFGMSRALIKGELAESCKISPLDSILSRIQQDRVIQWTN